MKLNGSQSPSADARLAALETELPHLWREARRAENLALEIRTEVAALKATLSRHGRIALLLATAATVHLSATPSASNFGKSFGALLGAVAKLL